MTSEPTSDDDLPTAIDAWADQLQALLPPTVTSEIDSRVRQEFAVSAHARSAFPRRSLTGEDAAAALASYAAELTDKCRSEVRGFSPVRWLWYMRRCPDSLFPGARRSTSAYDSALAEALTSFSSTAERSQPAQPIRFPVDPHVARRIARLAGATRLLSHVHVVYRYAGKGARIYVDNFVPMADVPVHVRDAAALYDQRHDSQRDVPLARLGVAGVDTAISTRLNRTSEYVDSIWTFHRCSALTLPVDCVNTEGSPIRANVHARFIPDVISIERLLRPYGNRQAGMLDYLQAVEPLVVLMMLVPVLLLELPWAFSSALQYGYFAVRSATLMNLAEQYLPTISARTNELAPAVNWSTNPVEWSTRIQRLAPSIWPLRPGAALRSLGDAVYVDVAGVTGAILGLAEIDRTRTDIGNLRAGHFEHQIQDLIDASDWRPSPALAQLRGRTLRKSGTDLTDIDAIGERDGVLLLISCKSVIYSSEYDKGEFRAVRNAQTVVDEAVERWETSTNVLTTAPGDNFDLTGYQSTIAVVCTPFVVYTDEPSFLRQLTDGLRAAVSADELRRWLFL